MEKFSEGQVKMTCWCAAFLTWKEHCFNLNGELYILLDYLHSSRSLFLVNCLLCPSWQLWPYTVVQAGPRHITHRDSSQAGLCHFWSDWYCSLISARLWPYNSADAPGFPEEHYDIAKDMILKVCMICLYVWTISGEGLVFLYENVCME